MLELRTRVPRSPTSASDFLPVLSAVPGWSEASARAAVVSAISGALTNAVFSCTSPAATENGSVILRVFGPGGQLFSRQEEQAVFLAAAALGIGPRCLLAFGNGRVEERLPGETLTAASMRLPGVSAAIASALAAFHVGMLAGAAPGAGGGPGGQALQSALWPRVLRWLGLVQELCPQHVEPLGLMGTAQEVLALRARVESWLPSWLGFCHNDLQYGNMLMQQQRRGAEGAEGAAQAGEGAPLAPAPAGAEAEPQGPSASETAPGVDGSPSATLITLIDYEYAGVNDVAFDVANHWCEWGADYHGATPHRLDLSALPSAAQQAAFCSAYVAAARQLAEVQPADGSPDQHAARALLGGVAAAGAAAPELLRAKAHALLPVSHLQWGLWGLIQDHFSEGEFDYLAYARQRLALWHDSKAVELT